MGKENRIEVIKFKAIVLFEIDFKKQYKNN